MQRQFQGHMFANLYSPLDAIRMIFAFPAIFVLAAYYWFIFYLCNYWRLLFVHQYILYLQTSAAALFVQVFDKLASTAEGGTMDSVWQILSWSFNCMQSGKWPRRDHLGHLWLSLHHVQFPQPKNSQT